MLGVFLVPFGLFFCIRPCAFSHTPPPLGPTNTVAKAETRPLMSISSASVCVGVNHPSSYRFAHCEIWFISCPWLRGVVLLIIFGVVSTILSTF